MPCLQKSSYPIFLLILTLFLSCANIQKNTVTLHYLGHSCVYIDFGKDISVLCDYGKENAYLEWGWDSPIYDAGEPGPDLITYSHMHNDHFSEARAMNYDVPELSGKLDTTLCNISITSYASSEKDISRYDNYSYLFSYRGINVLHLGDCQADIMMINDPAHAWNIDKRYPKGCDILIMPIEGTQKYILQAVRMVELLEPRVLIPTHYWSPEYKQEFLSEISRAYEKKNKGLIIDHIDGSEYIYQKECSGVITYILDLNPSDRHIEL